MAESVISSWRRPTAAEVDGIRVLAEQAGSADGIAPLSGQVLRDLGDDPVALACVGEQFVGVAVAHDGDPAEVVIAPAHRRRGYGRSLVGAALARSGRVWAHGDLPPARALAAALGLRPRRTLLQLRAELPVEVQARQLPPGYRIRPFTEADADGVIAVNASAFAWHPEQSRYSTSDFAEDRRQPWFDPAGLFVAVDADDRVAGFHWTKIHPTDPTPSAGADPGAAVGEVYVIGVQPGIRGLGQPLTVAGLEHLAAAGLRQVMLYVESDNAAALGLYERLNFQLAVRDVVYAAPDLAAREGSVFPGEIPSES